MKVILVLICCLKLYFALKTKVLQVKKTENENEVKEDPNEIEETKFTLSKTNNYFINPESRTPTTLKKLYNIKKVSNPNYDGFNYLNSAYFITNQEEYNLEQSRRFQFDSFTCTLDRFRLIDRINTLRDKHGAKALEYDPLLEAQAREVANRFKDTNNCEYVLEEKSLFSEIYSTNYKRINEFEVVQKWYETAYHYDFKKKVFKLNGINAYPMLNLLWDDTKKVGCAKVCCAIAELYVCDFFPVLIQPGLDEISKHIHENKYKLLVKK